MAGCLGFIVLVIVIWVWFLIYKYIGHTPLVNDYCIYFNCRFPDHYKRNWFGDIWIYSPLWLPVLILLVIWIKNNWKFVKEAVLTRKFKIAATIFSLGLIAALYIFISPIIKEKLEIKRTYDVAALAMKDEDYLSALDNFEKVVDYKDSTEQIDKIHSKLFEIVPVLIEEKRIYGNMDVYLAILSSVPKYKNRVNEMIKTVEKVKADDLSAARDKLRRTEPYEGMSEYNISLSSWGPPTEINKDVNYDAMREDRKVKHYKWIEKDSIGRTIKIKTLMVKLGHVCGEPKVHHYYQNN